MKLPSVRRPPWPHLLLAAAVGIPFVTSTLGGVSHRVSCRSEYTSDFDVLADGAANAVVSSALVLSRDAPAAKPRCPGFTIDAQINPAGPTQLTMFLTAKNASTVSVHATAVVTVDGDRSFVPLGVISSGTSEQRNLTVAVPKGPSVVRARLLLGG